MLSKDTPAHLLDYFSFVWKILYKVTYKTSKEFIAVIHKYETTTALRAVREEQRTSIR